jgi:hypothetical protein
VKRSVCLGFQFQHNHSNIFQTSNVISTLDNNINQQTITLSGTLPLTGEGKQEEEKERE